MSGSHPLISSTHPLFDPFVRKMVTEYFCIIHYPGGTAGLISVLCASVPVRMVSLQWLKVFRAVFFQTVRFLQTSVGRCAAEFERLLSIVALDAFQPSNTTFMRVGLVFYLNRICLIIQHIKTFAKIAQL